MTLEFILVIECGSDSRGNFQLTEFLKSPMMFFSYTFGCISHRFISDGHSQGDLRYECLVFFCILYEYTISKAVENHKTKRYSIIHSVMKRSVNTFSLSKEWIDHHYLNKCLPSESMAHNFNGTGLFNNCNSQTATKITILSGRPIYLFYSFFFREIPMSLTKFSLFMWLWNTNSLLCYHILFGSFTEEKKKYSVKIYYLQSFF